MRIRLIYDCLFPGPVGRAERWSVRLGEARPGDAGRRAVRDGGRAGARPTRCELESGYRVSLVEPDDFEVAALIDEMGAGLTNAPAIYRPGEFWTGLVAANLEMLKSEGIGNFKRTVSNNYYNWHFTWRRDPQIRRAMEGWVKRPTLAPLVNRLTGPASGLRTTVVDQPFALSRAAAWRYKFFVGAIWDGARRDDPSNLTSRLSEPTIGNPIAVRHRGRLISQDLANSIIEFNYAARSGVMRDGCRVGELGAGYGRLGYVFAQACEGTYCIFDIPPALAVAQWYLAKVLGQARIVPYSRLADFASREPQLGPGKVAFFTPDQLELFPNGWFDCTQTISTLPEMPANQATHYLELLAAKSRRALFLKQWRSWANPGDGSDLKEEHYVLEPPWQLAERREDPVQPAFFNQIWLR